MGKVELRSAVRDVEWKKGAEQTQPLSVPVGEMKLPLVSPRHEALVTFPSASWATMLG
jgi:hypothetical protein